MSSTEHLYGQLDDAKDALCRFDRCIAEAKESMRAALQTLGERTDISDDDGRCFGTILEAIDDLMSDERDNLRAWVSSIDEEIGDIEYADERRSAPMVL